MAAIPLVAVVLFFVFGGVIAASLPAIIGGLTIAGALGIMRLVAEFMPVHFFAQPVVTLMGLGIAVDYGLFMVSRFREEIAEGYDTEAAVRRTVMTSGRTIMFSAVILVASSVPLLLFPQGFLKSITYAIIASVMLAAILSITVLAAALAILGPNVDALGVRTLLRVPFLRNWKPTNWWLNWLAEKTQKTKTRARGREGLLGQAGQPGDEAARGLRRTDHHRHDRADHSAGTAGARRHQREVPPAGQLGATKRRRSSTRSSPASAPNP